MTYSLPAKRLPQCGNTTSSAALVPVPSGAGTLLLARAAAALTVPGARTGQSRLTPDGSAAELAFVWPGADDRITLDPCPGAPAPVRRTICTAEAAAGLSDAQRDCIARVAGWQREHGARWGAWLGLRIRDGQIARKLYLELPSGAPWAAWEAELAGSPLPRAARGAVATMVGLDPTGGGTEIYFSSGRLFPSDIPALLARIGLDAGDGAVTRFATGLARRRPRFELPSWDMGFSNAYDAKGRGVTFTWYSTAAGLLGPDHRTREGLLRFGAAEGWEMTRYAAMTAGVPPRHVLVGAALGAAGRPPAYTATVAMEPTTLIARCRRIGAAP